MCLICKKGSLTRRVLDKRYPGSPVGVILDTLQSPWDPLHVTLEVYDPVQALMAPAPVEIGDSALGIAAPRARFALREGLEGPPFPQRASVSDDSPPHACTHQSRY